MRSDEYCPDCDCELNYRPDTKNYFCKECDTVFELCPDCGTVTYDDEWDYAQKVCVNCADTDEDGINMIIVPLNDDGFNTLEEIFGE